LGWLFEAASLETPGAIVPEPTRRTTEEDLEQTISLINNTSGNSRELVDSPIQDNIISKVQVFKGVMM
jgi:hypothetical protein